MTTAAALATNCPSALGALHCAPCMRTGERRPGSRPSGPAQHPGQRDQSPTVRLGQSEHCRRGNAPAWPVRAERPSRTGDPPEPPGTGGDCHRSTSEVLHIAMPTRDLAPHLGNRDAADGALHPVTTTTTERGT